jgi:hypothetical protein
MEKVSRHASVQKGSFHLGHPSSHFPAYSSLFYLLLSSLTQNLCMCRKLSDLFDPRKESELITDLEDMSMTPTATNESLSMNPHPRQTFPLLGNLWRQKHHPLTSYPSISHVSAPWMELPNLWCILLSPMSPAPVSRSQFFCHAWPNVIIGWFNSSSCLSHKLSNHHGEPAPETQNVPSGGSSALETPALDCCPLITTCPHLKWSCPISYSAQSMSPAPDPNSSAMPDPMSSLDGASCLSHKLSNHHNCCCHRQHQTSPTTGQIDNRLCHFFSFLSTMPLLSLPWHQPNLALETLYTNLACPFSLAPVSYNTVLIQALLSLPLLSLLYSWDTVSTLPCI